MKKIISTILGILMISTCFSQKASATDFSSWTVPAAIISAGAVVATTIVVGYKILTSRNTKPITEKTNLIAEDMLKDESYSKYVNFFDQGCVIIEYPDELLGTDRKHRRPEKGAINRINSLLENTVPRLLEEKPISPREIYELSEFIKGGYGLFGLWCDYPENSKTKALYEEMKSKHENFMRDINRAYHHGRKDFVPNPITIRYFVNYLQDMKKMLKEASKRIDEHFAELERNNVRWGT